MMRLGEVERVTDTHVYFVGGPFSQWYPSEFKSVNYLDLMTGRDGQVYTYHNAEQWMMHSKAIIMRDFESADLIINEEDPSIIKKYGRDVKNYDEKVWSRLRYSVVMEGNIIKFNDPEFRKFIDSSGSRKIVEAAWYDCIWGVGLRQSDNDILDEKKWRGQNLLGKVLMDVRGNVNHNEQMPYSDMRDDIVELITNPRGLEKW